MEKPERSSIVNFIKEQSNPLEKEAVQAWINASEENKKEFEQLKKVWDSYESKASGFNPDMNAAWKKIESRIETKSEFKISPWFYRVAAMLVIGFGLIFMLVDDKPNVIAENKQVPPTELRTGDKIKEVTLPDGSVITLNSGSSIKYASDFGIKDRHIHLEGEAFFDIERDENKPFIISSKSTTTTVLGTSFSIYPSENELIINVVSGKVSFSGENSEEMILLTKGEKGNYSYSSNSISKSNNDDLNFLSWKTGQLIFKDAPFSDVVSDLEKHYHATIEVRDKDIQRLTATFENQNLEEVLEIISSTLDVKLDKHSESHYSFKK